MVFLIVVSHSCNGIVNCNCSIIYVVTICIGSV